MRKILFVVLFVAARAQAGGGVILQDDACIITIGFYTAHFTAYQPQTSGNREFCEDLPDTGESIFVLDYLHQSLKEVPVDFRIIRDVTGLGRFVKYEDVAALEDIDAHTVFYQPPTVQPTATFRISHDFVEKGDYVGIVSAGHPTNDKVYYSVFPFRVGSNDWIRWLALVGGALLLFAALGVYALRIRGGASQ